MVITILLQTICTSSVEGEDSILCCLIQMVVARIQSQGGRFLEYLQRPRTSLRGDINESSYPWSESMVVSLTFRRPFWKRNKSDTVPHASTGAGIGLPQRSQRQWNGSLFSFAQGEVTHPLILSVECRRVPRGRHLRENRWGWTQNKLGLFHLNLYSRPVKDSRPS